MHVKRRFKTIVRYKNSDMIYTSVGGWVSKNKMSERRATKASDCERSRCRLETAIMDNLWKGLVTITAGRTAS